MGKNYGELRLKSDLSDWAEQGVLLLNSVLTVRRRFPGSHKYIGWEKFTDNVIDIISKEKKGLVFMLWGNYAKGKEKYINIGERGWRWRFYNRCLEIDEEEDVELSLIHI